MIMMDKVNEYPIKESIIVSINREIPKKKVCSIFVFEIPMKLGNKSEKIQVLPRFELGSLDSKSKVLTATP